ADFKELVLVILAESQSETEILIPFDGNGNGKGPFSSLQRLMQILRRLGNMHRKGRLPKGGSLFQ
ncbi:hypothetical protein EJB05_47382, partial [Eragrostis curvula]